MTALQAVRDTNSSALASASRTAWMAHPAAPQPFQTAGTVIHVSAGHEIFAEGDASDAFYKVISGTVRLCKFLSDGRRQIEAFHVADEIFGFELGGEHVLCAEAVSECTLVSYRRRNVEALAKADQTVARQLFQYALKSLAQARERSLLLGRRGAAEKVAIFLLQLAKNSSDKCLINLAMTRQDIADYLGLTIETVSRSLSQLERDGLIALPNAREIRLSKFDLLQDIAA
jgi:CRP/FNR family nitrogen fixation transcriptional regulator